MNNNVIITDIDKLRQPCKRVKHFEEVNEIAYRLRKILEKIKDGIGLAAPQIGIFKQVAIVKNKWRNGYITLYNPTIISRRGLTTYQEGCLSLPNQNYKTVRNTQIKIHMGDKTFDIDGLTGQTNEEIQRSLLECVCLQHEIDHLYGILIPDRIAPYEEKRITRLDKRVSGTDLEWISKTMNKNKIREEI